MGFYQYTKSSMNSCTPSAKEYFGIIIMFLLHFSKWGQI